MVQQHVGSVVNMGVVGISYRFGCYLQVFSDGTDRGTNG